MYSPLLQLSSVVAEREKGLRQALKTMGMLESCECCCCYCRGHHLKVPLSFIECGSSCLPRLPLLLARPTPARPALH